MSLLSGTVEIDETYIGGKAKPGSKRGRGTAKVPVVALGQREGRVRAKPVHRVNARELKGAIREAVHRDSRVITDEWSAYRGLDKEFSGGHDIVNHGKREYVRGDVHVNTIESYFALLKRGIHGTFHQLSWQSYSFQTHLVQRMQLAGR